MIPPAAQTTHTQQVIERARRFKLNWGRTPLSGQVGEKMGNQVGASMEFHDYRPYAPGDDVRHIDWKAYGRSDTLMVRLFREEISPRVDLIVDETSSMAATADKLARLRDLAMLFTLTAQEARANVRLFGPERPRHIMDPLHVTGPLANRQDPWTNLGSQLRWRALRIVISDFLFPHDPVTLLRTFARDAAQLYVIQLNTPEETDPPFRGPYRFEDVEDHGQLDIQIGQKEIDAYKARFHRLRDDLMQETARAQGIFCTLTSTLSLDDTIRELVRNGILEAA